MQQLPASTDKMQSLTHSQIPINYSTKEKETKKNQFKKGRREKEGNI